MKAWKLNPDVRKAFFQNFIIKATLLGSMTQETNAPKENCNVYLGLSFYTLPQPAIVIILAFEQLNSLTSIVQQEVFLFNMSMEENIRIGKPDATMGEIIDADKKARIHDFICSLPQGYQFRSGESGIKFSGGEKQRISIARMILKDSPIIILDEATAAVDAENGL